MHHTIGKIGEDQITKFKGTIIARVEYLTGCTQYLIQPKGKSDKRPDAEWFDEQRIKIVGESKVSFPNNNPGCDRPAPKN